MKKILSTVAVIGSVFLLSACEDAAKIASQNTSKAADNFEIPRRISVVNGITDKVVMKMEGYCSLQSSSTHGRMAIICKTEDGEYVKNFLDKSDNVFVLTEQLAAVKVSTFHYRIVFRPQAVIPDIDFQGSTDELTRNKNTDG